MRKKILIIFSIFLIMAILGMNFGAKAEINVRNKDVTDVDDGDQYGGMPTGGGSSGGNTSSSSCPPHSYSAGNCQTLKICTKCWNSTNGYGNHVAGSQCSQPHCNLWICSVCGAHIDGTCGGGHDMIWTGDATQHWMVCRVANCSATSGLGYHSEGTAATCTSSAVCSTCGRAYGNPLNHNYVGGTCQQKSKCSNCGAEGDTVAHSYTSTCSQHHCGGTKCCWCSAHQSGTCGGGCNTLGYCNHCQVNYCNKTCSTPGCTICGHTCTHNTSGSCTDPHCSDIQGWCTNCARSTPHTHKTCSDWSSSFYRCGYFPPNGHCNAYICPKCMQHQTPCGGGHQYSWEGSSSKSSPTEKHKKVCTVSGCTSTDSEHDPAWGTANASHTATCRQCGYYTYTHAADYTDPNNPHRCVGNNGNCEATHTPVWSAYYKITENEHARACTVGNCVVVETHSFEDASANPWNWHTTDLHIKTCAHTDCGLTTTQSHSFRAGDPAYDKKAIDATNHTELYKHWLVCKTCDATVPTASKPHGNVDEEHTDDGTGKCSKCGQILWKIVTDSGVDITDYVLGINTDKLPAKNNEKVKIIEIKTGAAQYVQNIYHESIGEVSATSNFITITKNGEYRFNTCRGGVAHFSINHISDRVIIDRIITPVTSTRGTVTITLRSAESETQFNKKIFIKKGNSISDSELNSGSNPYTFSETVTKNDTYTFIAGDTAGNTEIIQVVIDNIIKGQATVAISNDVFINGYAFTEILINPNESWEINKDNIANIVNAKVYKIGNATPASLNSSNIRLVKVMDMQRRDITSLGPTYPAGEYYLQIAIGGSVFNQKATYIVNLENVKFGLKTLNGQNRIIVEVQDLKDLT